MSDEPAGSDPVDDEPTDDGPAGDDRTPAPDESASSGVETVAIDELLIPVDGSAESMDAMEYATAIAERYDARVHALYVLDEGTVRAVSAGDIEESEIAARGEEFIGTAREHAPDSVSLTFSTAYGFSPTRKARHPGSVIVDTAADAAVDFIVIPREPGGASSDETLSKAAEYVLQYADQPVLST